MKHFCHEHALILNDKYIAKQGDVCFCCREEIVSCKSFIYSCIFRSTQGTTSTSTGSQTISCSKFLLHQTCANLPYTSIENPTDPKKSLYLSTDPRKNPTLFQREMRLRGDKSHCTICDIELIYGYSNSDSKFCLCLKCAMFLAKELTITHVAHPQHSLALIHRPSSFKCDACNVEENVRDMSYKCKTCPFWIHKSCADAPNLVYLFQSLHEHPLVLFYGRPQGYHKYYQWCRLCNENISQLSWFYKCRDCTFFTHMHCAKSRSSKSRTYDSNLVHLPPADESSKNLLLQQFVKSMGDNNSRGDPNRHHKHPLQLITSDELNNQKADDSTMLLCDGCIKPIGTDGDRFYGCVVCKFFLHRGCAELPENFWKDLLPGTNSCSLMFRKPYDIFSCDWCGVYSNGICVNYYNIKYGACKIQIECLNLPKTIKHEAHRHQLNKVSLNDHACNACEMRYRGSCKHWCEQCDFYICQGCNMKARTVTHPWDPHPLHLRYDAGMVMDHDYEFNCEFCSEEINTNFWFYHCSDCDLSFHLGYCFDMSSFRIYSNVKFGQTDISRPRLHHHSLRFVLNRKVRSCQKCDTKLLGKPVLECTPCKAIFCDLCALYFYA